MASSGLMTQVTTVVTENVELFKLELEPFFFHLRVSRSNIPRTEHFTSQSSQKITVSRGVVFMGEVVYLYPSFQTCKVKLLILPRGPSLENQRIPSYSPRVVIQSPISILNKFKTKLKTVRVNALLINSSNNHCFMP
uniref:Uncharacterized protein n=1 Tax=Cannabis sativa TaxID=3483 RepID=A0A803Q0T3_CANSA